MFSKETFIHDAELEIIIPNGTLVFNEENIDNIIDAQQRTQVFYDEKPHVYLVTTLPSESNFENKKEATKFFKNLEVKLKATLIDTPNLSNLTVPTSNYTSELSRTSSSSSTSSSVSGIFSSNTSISSTTTSIFTHGSPNSDYSLKKLSSKVIEGTVIYSANYDSKNNNEMVVVERDDCWICVLQLSFPIDIKARAQNQIALDVTVTQHRRNSPDSDLYSPEHFGMNLLGGLIDDPAFESLNFSIPTPQFAKKEKTSIYSTLSSTPIKRCSRKIISVRPTLNARIRSTYVSPSDKTVMMSVELENDTENDVTFSIEHLDVGIAHGIVTEITGYTQDTSNDKFKPITLRPFDQINFLYNVTILEDPSFPEPSNTQQFYPSPIPHSKVSSRRESIASINSANISPVENNLRTLSVIVKGSPIIDGVKSHLIESKWDCELDISTLFNDDSMASSQLREMESNRFIPMMYNNKFNFGIGEEINIIDKATTIRDSSSSSNVKSYDNIKCGNDSSNVELEINVNGVNIASKKQHSGYIPETNLLSVNDENNGILPYGRLPKLQQQMNSDLNACDGTSVSFEVCDKPVVGKVFTMKVSIVNKSKHARRFTIMVPNKKRSNERLFNNHHLSHKSSLSDITLVEYNNNYEYIKRPLEEPFMDETVFMRKHSELVTPDADLICLDNDVRIGPISPNKSESATLHFISTKEVLHMIELVQLVDDDTGFITNLRNVIQINVAKNERRRDYETNSLKANWTSENKVINELIRHTQLNVSQACDYLERIPFEKFEMVKRMKRMKRIDHNSFVSKQIGVTC